ncbi:MAG: 3-deoxy-manno-octulosonate cytidylyltransferase [Gammaproteobacteria bacterium]|nr:3-deoxy-manno-octulosonate cytidylyltransferase [Gammaproteobacteria bacterium]MCD8542932.1 3-deoxy-manno-octulosonate cytidylyltransferase [Gammaproteobacteria bacterium]
MAVDIAIVIPARFGSSRFPGKPLAKIGDKTMLAHTCDVALSAARSFKQVAVIVATEDSRIFEYADTLHGVIPVMTPVSCPTGSDRVLSALDVLQIEPSVVINLQGDAPFTPPHVVAQIAQALVDFPEYAVATPAVRLSWSALHRLRENKKITPFSGTTVVMNSRQQALWFSKNIIPAIRHEEKLKLSERFSPVYQHIGLYAYRLSALRQFVGLPESNYETIEGLEQLRLLENGLPVRVEVVAYDAYEPISGVDTPEDLQRAEKVWLSIQK